MGALLLAIDVGSRGTRAGALDEKGRLVALAERPIDLLEPGAGQAVYRMDAVWQAVGEAIRACLSADPGLGQRIVGLCFDATQSLVLDHDGPPPLAGEADVFSWMDRRGDSEAAAMSELGMGDFSADSHLPKLRWLKRHHPDAWARITGTRCLVDELARRATGNDRHALATLATRWPYAPRDPDPWNHAMLAAVGLDDVWGFGALAGDPVPLGQVHGPLLQDVAAALGLPPGIPVSPGLLDGQAGLLGTIGRNPAARWETSAALIAGVTAPLLLLSSTARDIPGINGPHADAVLPGLWFYEAGQPWSGGALDHILDTHPGGPHASGAAEHDAAARDILALLDAEGPAFAATCHILPGQPGDVALTMGLGTGRPGARSRRGCLETYYAAARGLALQASEGIARLKAHGFPIERVALAGGQAHNPLMQRLYRDALGADLVVSRHPNPVLLGSAMMAAVAAGVHPDIMTAIERMSAPQARLVADPFWHQAHAAAYEIYQHLAATRDHAARAAQTLAAPSLTPYGRSPAKAPSRAASRASHE